MKTKTTLLLLILLAAASTAGLYFSYKKEDGEKKSCAENQIRWWMIYQDYLRTNPKLVPGSEEPNLGAKLAAHTSKMKQNPPSFRCPNSGKDYIFSKTLPLDKELPATCPEHKQVIRWEEKTGTNP